MTSFTDLWTSLAQPGQAAPFIIIDCAGIEGGANQIPRHVLSVLECLFAGSLAVELAEVAPYLGQLSPLSPEVTRVAEALLTKQVAMLVLPKAPLPGEDALTFSQMHRHLRKFNLVEGPDGKQVFFRYYDSRLITDILQVLDAGQLVEFFGPIDTFVIADQRSKTVKCLRQAMPVEPPL